MILTKNFKLDELCRSETGERLGLCNVPTDNDIINLKRLANEILQPLRDHLAQPIIITSAFRSPRVNRAVGGSERSQHMVGQAADIRVANMPIAELIETIKNLDLPYHQLINEFDSWVHVSIAPTGQKPKKQILHFKR
jgi:uncharacterized protein YcbK (DUF882 family)